MTTDTYTQVRRPIAATVVGLPEDTILLRGFDGREGLSQLFRFQLDLASADNAINFDAVVGKKATIRLSLSDGRQRLWNGYISRFTQELSDGYLVSYRAEVVPWLWMLTRRANCRIFQNMDVPAIVGKIFSDAGFGGQFEFKLFGDFRKRDYCVQYRETDFSFVSRLLAEEGISYFFRHEETRHVLVLANGPAAHKPCGGTVRYEATAGTPSHGTIQQWAQREEICSGKYTVKDFNPEHPSVDLLVSRVVEDTNDAGEVYDYPGEYADRTAGDRIAKLRLEEQLTPRAMAHGRGVCREFAAGYTFELLGHYRRDINRSYLLTSVSHHVRRVGNFRSGFEEPGIAYENSFVCAPFPGPFRPRRFIPKPFVRGCQTAIVTGPVGEEIYTDESGRVKVQFHWDREGKQNQDSSCWLRVSQPLAGQRWGAIAIPRVGQEAIIEFLEGDPDRPIVIGTVYNAEQRPPYELPGQADMIGLRSNSTKGGGGYNEIVMRDRTTDELVRIRAQKNMNITVLHDHKELVRHNKNIHVLRDLRTHVANDASSVVDGEAVAEFRRNHVELVSGERRLKAGRIILEADEAIEIKVGGSHITISSSGVFVDGEMVDINCGHPPLQSSVPGPAPVAPDDPE